MALRVTRALLTAPPKPPPPPTVTGPTSSRIFIVPPELSSLRTTTLEVERKFRRLTLPTLTPIPGGANCSYNQKEQHKYMYTPAFESVVPLPTTKIHDIYYDTKHRTLSFLGAYIRKRNGVWEAKVRRGGDSVNSRFEEVVGRENVGGCIRGFLGEDSKYGNGVKEEEEEWNFGLEKMADFVTSREAWLVDGKFKVVRDRMDFGHEVGEVELQTEIALAYGTTGLSEEGKAEEMEKMDRRIEAFMERYKWAWERGEAVGKLTAYFEMVERKGGG